MIQMYLNNLWLLGLTAFWTLFYLALLLVISLPYIIYFNANLNKYLITNFISLAYLVLFIAVSNKIYKIYKTKRFIDFKDKVYYEFALIGIYGLLYTIICVFVSANILCIIAYIKGG